MKFGHKIFGILCLIIAAQFLYYYSRLPETLAVHFNETGAVNGWQGKGNFVFTFIGIVVVILLPFVILPLYLDRIPQSLISMPNRDYWFAPERKKETIRYLKRQLLVMGNGTLVFMITILQSVFHANLKTPPTLAVRTAIIILVCYLIFSLGWIVILILRFSRKKIDQSKNSSAS